MAQLAANMPQVQIPQAELLNWGQHWLTEVKDAAGKITSAASAFNKKQGMDFGKIFDEAVGRSLSEMLGGIPIVVPSATALIPSPADCVEVGPARVVGGIRPQNYDVAYRPDGVRFAFDSKTLNDSDSVGKNWQNMINDLATEASTVHTRFPYAVVGFMVVIPEPALSDAKSVALIRTLERMATRQHVNDEAHLAEAIALVVWNPNTGLVSDAVPVTTSHLHLRNFPKAVFDRYVERYKGLPPHD